MEIERIEEISIICRKLVKRFNDINDKEALNEAMAICEELAKIRIE